MWKPSAWPCVALALIGCASSSEPLQPSGALAASNGASSRAARASSCARTSSLAAPTPIGARGASTTVALAQGGGARVAYVADEDSHALHTVDLDSRRALARTRLAGAPSSVLVLGDGRVAVALRDRNSVVVLEPRGAARPLAELCTADVPTEPVSLALAGKDLLVTSAWARRLTALDVTGEPRARFSVALPREPRAVVVAADGRRAFVSHVVGAKMSVVDLDGDHATRALSLGVRAEPVSSGAEADRTGCQGFALATWTRGADERVFAPMVAVSPRGGEADPFGITVIGGGYYGYSQRDAALASPPKETPLVSVVEGSREEPLTTTVAPLGGRLGSECLLPRAAAVRASTGSLFVTCLGADVVLELDARGKDPARLERRRVHVAAGPTGVAIDDARAEAVVWSQFAPKLTVVPLDGPADQPMQPVAIDVDYAPVGMTEAFAAGRLLFHRSADLAITRDGIACASCHPDARDDAITWTTPDGPRQTIPLAGRTDGAAPYGWPGQHATLTTYIANTVNRLGGLGLGPVELDALAAYVRGARAPHVASLSAPAELLARGKALFESHEQGCGACHVRGATDGLLHDVGSAATGDDREDFDTPSLRFVGGSAPYFHDGRYATLDALLAAKDHKMGRAWTLDAADRHALVAYLESL